MKFPREVGPPRKTVFNFEDYIKFVNTYNGKKRAVYHSVYSYDEIFENNKPNYNSAIIDRLYFDFDDKSCNAYDECWDLHNELLEENIKHHIIMSGRGYHLFVHISTTRPNNPKSCLYNAQHYFIDKLKLNVDTQVVGNVAQLARVPNTYNSKGKRFCIPLTIEQFYLGDKKIKELASKQNFVKKISIGEKLFDIHKFDIKKDNIDDIEFNTEFEDMSNINYEHCDKKIKQLLLKKELGWKERFIVIMYFKERGFTIKEVYNILKENLTDKKFKHCVSEERQLQYLFERNDLMFPESFGVKIYK